MNSIRVTFSIADINALDTDLDSYTEDKAQYDETDEAVTNAVVNGQSGGAQSKGTTTKGD